MMMSSREFIALGTSSQVPTRERSHNSYLLRWDGEDFLWDPGEGTQRQLTLAGISAVSVRHICITHFHGDHCLGLAGVVQRLSLEQCGHPVHLYYPESGQPYVERLSDSAIFRREAEIIWHPIKDESEGMVELYRTDKYVLQAHPLDHSVPTVGFRLEELEGVRFIPEKLDSAKVIGPMVGELQRKGYIRSEDRMVRLEEVSVRRPGSIFAFIMDTSPCPGAVALAKDADLLVMEATYTSEHKSLAKLYLHSTAADAADVACRAGARQLALTHFSQRYLNVDQHLQDARRIFANVIVLNDLDHIEIPRRRYREQKAAADFTKESES
jgi:ribonuclease Z